MHRTQRRLSFAVVAITAGRRTFKMNSNFVTATPVVNIVMMSVPLS